MRIGQCPIKNLIILLRGKYLAIKVSIIYPVEPSYIIGLLDGLGKISELKINFLGSNRSVIVKDKYHNIRFINIRGSQDPNDRPISKIIRIIKFYFRLFIYCIKDNSDIYHSHFPNKFLFLDFVVINLLLKIKGTKIVHTAHNIDYNLRDKKQSIYKTIIFNFLYRAVDKIIVHNNHSLRVLVKNYPFTKNKVDVIRIGINITSVKTGLSKTEARNILNIDLSAKVLLFFGGINPYKGLETLLIAFAEIIKSDSKYLLLIAGSPRDEEYFKEIKSLIEKLKIENFIKANFQFIPENEIEKYFVSSDCCILPYRAIFQSGVHVLSYSFGIPVIVSDVGSFKEEDVIEGKTGFIFQPDNPSSLKLAIQKFFNSSLYLDQEYSYSEIREWARDTYSWEKIGMKTFSLYKNLLEND